MTEPHRRHDVATKLNGQTPSQGASRVLLNGTNKTGSAGQGGAGMFVIFQSGSKASPAARGIFIIGCVLMEPDTPGFG